MEVLKNLVFYIYDCISSAPLLVATASLVLIAFHYYNKNAFSYWEKRGIKGPKPLPLIGNMAALFSKNRAKYEMEWFEKYGKVYGIYEGYKPQLVCADPDLLVKLCIKDFDKFTNRNVLKNINEYARAFLFLAKDESWKKLRVLMSPTFTSGKMRRMFKFMDICSNDLVKCIEERRKGESSVTLNTPELFNYYALDMISSCCYGLKIKLASNQDYDSQSLLRDNETLRDMMKALEFSTPKLILSFCIPEFVMRFFKIQVLPGSEVAPAVEKVKMMIQNRRTSSAKFDDYLQLLLDAKMSDASEERADEDNYHNDMIGGKISRDAEEKVFEDAKQLAKKTKSGATLSDLEIISCAVFLISASLHTSSVLLSSSSYLLAFHQGAQDKLYEELMEFSKEELTYESLSMCKYLDAVISETLRIYTPVLFVDRVADEDYHIAEYDVTLKKGDVVSLSLHALLNDPDYWSEPDKFKPERFLPESKETIHPGSYCPFGIGPRHCIGMRFALLEAKLALAKIIINFKLMPAPGTEFPTELMFGETRFFTAQVKNPTVSYTTRAH